MDTYVYLQQIQSSRKNTRFEVMQPHNGRTSTVESEPLKTPSLFEKLLAIALGIWALGQMDYLALVLCRFGVHMRHFWKRVHCAIYYMYRKSSDWICVFFT